MGDIASGSTPPSSSSEPAQPVPPTEPSETAATKRATYDSEGIREAIIALLDPVKHLYAPSVADLVAALKESTPKQDQAGGEG